MSIYLYRPADDTARSTPERHQQEATVSALLGLAYHYVDEAIVQAILEELSMANPLITMFEERETRGELNGTRRALRTVLRARFGALPESAEQRIDAADAQRLDELLSRAATAQDLDELWR